MLSKALVVLVALGAATLAAAQPPRSLRVEPATAPPGAIAWVALRSLGDDVIGIQADLVIPPEAQLADATGKPLCEVNPSIHRNNSAYAFLPHDCQPGVDCRSIRAVVIDYTRLAFDFPIPDGSVAYRCAVRAPAEGVLPIGCEKAGSAGSTFQQDSNWDASVDCAPGSVTVVPGCAVGDANGDSTVTIDEVLRTVDAALGGCP